MYFVWWPTSCGDGAMMLKSAPSLGNCDFHWCNADLSAASTGVKCVEQSAGRTVAPLAVMLAPIMYAVRYSALVRRNSSVSVALRRNSTAG